MKTQIKDLINGAKTTVRMGNAPKYQNAAKATSHNGYAGTNSKERDAVAAKVAEENKTAIVAEINGETFTLYREQSKSGKSWWWCGFITKDLYRSFCGIPNDKDTAETYGITITMTCTVLVYKIKGNGKTCGIFPIDEAFITIK